MVFQPRSKKNVPCSDTCHFCQQKNIERRGMKQNVIFHKLSNKRTSKSKEDGINSNETTITNFRSLQVVWMFFFFINLAWITQWFLVLAWGKKVFHRERVYKGFSSSKEKKLPTFTLFQLSVWLKHSSYKVKLSLNEHRVWN